MEGPGEQDWRQRLDALPTTRSCAGCEVCCTLMAIRELDKPPGRPCAHLAVSGGCGIWGDHPASCRAFTCLWRRSDVLLPREMFPPDCGFMLAVDKVESWPTAVMVCAAADRPGAWDQPHWRAIFSRLAKAWNCAVVAVTLEDHLVRGLAAFAPSGRVYERDTHPEIFPADGRELAVPTADYDADYRPPIERIAEADFRWDGA